MEWEKKVIRLFFFLVFSPSRSQPSSIQLNPTGLHLAIRGLPSSVLSSIPSFLPCAHYVIYYLCTLLCRSSSTFTLASHDSVLHGLDFNPSIQGTGKGRLPASLSNRTKAKQKQQKQLSGRTFFPHPPSLFYSPTPVQRAGRLTTRVPTIAKEQRSNYRTGIEGIEPGIRTSLLVLLYVFTVLTL